MAKARVLPDTETPIRPSEKELSKLPTDVKAAYVMDTWDEWSRERQNKENIWLECERAYLSKHDDRANPNKWKSKAYVPATHTAVENIHAQIMRGAFPTSDFFSADAAVPFSDTRAQAVTSLLRYFTRRSCFRSEFSKYLKQLIIIGNSAAIIDWYKEMRGGEVVYEGPRFRTLDMRYFHVDPFNPHSNPNVCHRYWMSHEELERSGLFDEDGIEALEKAAAQTMTSQQDAQAVAAKQAHDLQGNFSKARGAVELTEMWGSFEIDGYFFENYVITIGNGHVVLRCEPSPYESGRHPFIFSTYNPVAGEAYGVGAVEPALDLQYLINTFTNQKVDELSIIINGIWKYVDDGVIDPDETVVEPGVWIEVGEMGNLQPLQPSQTVTLAYNEIQDLERKFEEATGAIKLVAGGAPSQVRTATEAMAITQSGSARFEEILAHIEETSMRPALQLYLSHAAQYIEEATAVRIVGPAKSEWLRLDPDDIRMEYEITLGGSKTLGLREMRLANLLKYLQVVGSIQQIAGRLDWDKVNGRIWRELGFDEDENLLMQKPTGLEMMEEGGAQAVSGPESPQMGVGADPTALLAQMMGGAEGGVE